MKERFPFLLKLIREAGDQLKSDLKHSPEKMTAHRKGVNDLVTNYDLAVETALVDRIKSLFPHDHIFAEEGTGKDQKFNGITWLIDPIDGTSNLYHTYPFFCISIAVSLEKEIQFGAVYNPLNQEIFYALKGYGAYHNNNRIQAPKEAKLSEALLASGFPYRRISLAKQQKQAISLFMDFHKNCHGIRRDGAAALDLCYVAMGRLNGFYEMMLKPWDIAAGLLIINEAGGICLNFKGKPANFLDKDIVCAPQHLANEMIKRIKSNLSKD